MAAIYIYIYIYVYMYACIKISFTCLCFLPQTDAKLPQRTDDVLSHCHPIRQSTRATKQMSPATKQTQKNIRVLCSPLIYMYFSFDGTSAMRCTHTRSNTTDTSFKHTSASSARRIPRVHNKSRTSLPLPCRL
jgi:hypothetical protein